MSKPLRFFIAGIIQGSLPDTVHPQDYRSDMAVMLRDAFPGSDVVVENLDGLREIVANGFLARAITAKTEGGAARPPAQ